MFSIIIPTFNNKRYLELCIKSIKKNSEFNHEIIPHVNIGNDGTINLLKNINIDFSHTRYNAGICEGMNRAAKKAKSNYILYAHDDFYFAPNWDDILDQEVKKIGHNRFFLSGTGSQTAALAFNGQSTKTTQQFNGTSWTEVNDQSLDMNQGAGSGTQTAALLFGSQIPGNTAKTEEWNPVDGTQTVDDA